MKKPFLTFAIAITALSALIAGSSCTKEHVHTFSETWSTNETRHWKDATCEHTDVTQSNGMHAFGLWSEASAPTCEKEGVEHRLCTVCGYEETRKTDLVDHPYAATYSKDENYHWYAATCSHTDQVKAKAEHDYSNNDRTCTVCGYIDTKPQGVELQAKDFTAVTGTKYKLTVPNATDEYSFYSVLTLAEDAYFSVFTDKKCTNEIVFSTVNLEEGNNVFYVRVQNGFLKELYTFTIYRKKCYTVTFDTLGGPAVESQKVEENEHAKAPQTLTREGYAFVSWNYDFSNPVTEDITVKAVWNPNSYTVSLDPNGGVGDTSLGVTFDEDFILPTPTRTGYAFNGWYLGDTQFKSGTWCTLSDVSLTAKWTVTTSLVTLVNEKGAFDGMTEGATFDSPLTLPEPSAIGYTFDGWYLGETKMENGAVWQVVEDVTLTAKWTIITYKVTLDAKGGVCEQTEIALHYGDLLTLPAPTKPGYSFLGWYDEETKKEDGNWERTADLSLVAKWSANTYLLTFTDEKGICDVGELQVTYGQAFDLPELSLVGHAFDGWFDGENEVTCGTWLGTADIALTAKWTANTYTLTFNAGKGTCVPSELSVVYGSSFTLPTPTYVGYVFLGWFDGDTRVENGVWQTLSDLSLRARWTVNKNIPYTVLHYRQNLEDDNYTLFDTENLTGQAFSAVTVACKDYAGFTPDYQSQTVKIAPDGSLVVSFYYERNTITVYYQPNNGESVTSQTLKAYDPKALVVTPSRSGFSFGGWFTDAELKTSATELYETGTLYAYWKGETKAGDFTYTIDKGVVTLTKYQGTASSVVLPLYIGGGTVQKIGASCFSGNKTMTSLTMHNRINVIGNDAFADITYLSSLYVFDLTAWCNITFGNNFSNPCINGVDFYLNGSLLKDIVIPESITAIKNYAFHYNNTSTSLTIHKDVTSIGDYAFGNCTKLTSLTFEDGSQCKYIGQKSFQTCKCLTSLVIPTSVTNIGNSAFYNCNGLTSVTFERGSHCETIETDAFRNCTKLTSFIVPITVKRIGTQAFDQTSGLTVYCHVSEKPSGWTNTWNSGVANTVWNYSTITYTVKHYRQNIENDEYSLFETETLIGDDLLVVTPAIKTYTGFTSPAETQTVDVKTDSTTLVEYYYGRNTYEVTFDANEGNCTTASFQVKYGETVTLPDATRTGYEFDGWYDGTTKVENGAWNYAEDKALKAKWTAKTYTVTLNVGTEGTCDQASVTVTFDQPFTLPTPTSATHIFGGWYEDTTKIENGTWTYSENKSLTAKWERVPFTVTFAANGGSAVPSLTDYYGTAFPATLLTDRTGYTFGGWYTDTDLQTSISSIPSYDVTVYAKWNEETSPASFTYTIGEDSVTVDKYLGSDTTVVVPAYIGDKPVGIIGVYAFQKAKVQNVTLPETLTEIYYAAFEECRALTAVNIPSGVTSIGAYAFKHCEVLTSINIPDAVVYVGPEAFYYCSSLACAITVPSGVETICQKTFFGCKKITSLSFASGSKCAEIGEYAFYLAGCSSVTLPDSLKTLGSCAFASCELTSVTIPASVESISSNAFNQSKLVSISFEEGSACTTIGERSFSQISTLKSIVIPKSVITIEGSAFYGSVALESVTFEKISSCTTIGNFAFAGCTSLSTIIIPVSVTKIGYAAFDKDDGILICCEANGEQNRPIGWDSQWNIVNFWGTGASFHTVYWNYWEEYLITFVNNGGEFLAPGCAKDGGDLSTLVPKRAGYTFDGWYSDADLTTPVTEFPSMKITLYAKWKEESAPSLFDYTEENGAITVTKYKGTQTEVGIPAYIGNKPVTAIGNEAFMNNTTLVSVSIPDSVSVLGNYVFYKCSALQTVTFKGNSECTALGDYTFSNCSSLTSVSLPSGVTKIGLSAFSGSGLISITIPASVTMLDSGAFSLSRSLKTVAFADNSKCTSIGANAFSGCNKLEAVFIPKSVETILYNAFSGCTALASVDFEAPAAISSLGQCAFQDCTSLSSIFLPVSITSMGEKILNGTDGVSVFCEAQSKPGGWNDNWLGGAANSTVTWGQKQKIRVTFNTCGGEDLAPVSLVFGTSLDGYTAQRDGFTFGGWYSDGNLTNAVSEVPLNDIKLFAKWNEETPASAFSYTTENDAVTITKYNGSETNVIVPAFIGGNPVTVIGDRAFLKTSIVTLFLPKTVTSIENESVYSCKQLTKVEIESNSACTKFGNNAFSWCKDLSSVTFPEKLELIDEEAFYDCSSLKNVEIPSSVTSIGKMAFMGCSSLSSLTFAPDSHLKTIGSNAFKSCVKLKTVVIPKSVTTIGFSAFSHCSGLANVRIETPSQCTEIGGLAFEYCSSLHYFFIPISVTTTGYSLFTNTVDYFEIFVEAAQAQEGWDESWNHYKLNTDLPNKQIHYGATLVDVSFVTNGGTAIDKMTVPVGCSLSNFIPAREDSIFGSWYADASLTTLITNAPDTDTTVYAGWIGETKSGMFDYTVENEQVTITKYTGAEVQVTVPAFINDKPVTAIGNMAFQNAKISSLSLPESVSRIGAAAFENCIYLKSFVIPAAVETVNASTFAGTNKLTTITFAAGTKCKTISAYAFENAIGLSSIVIPNTVQTIGKGAFSGCSALASVTFEATSVCTSIGDNAFKDCTALASVFIPVSVTTLGNAVFENGTSSLLHVYIEAADIPGGWDSGWNYMRAYVNVKTDHVHLGSTGV